MSVEAVQRLFTCINDGRYAATADHLADDARMEIPYAPQNEPAPGRDTLAAFLAMIYADRFVGLRFTIDRAYPAAEPGLLFIEYHADATMRTTGRPYKNQYMGVFRVRDGKVALWKEFYNPVEVLRALGKID